MYFVRSLTLHFHTHENRSGGGGATTPAGDGRKETADDSNGLGASQDAVVVVIGIVVILFHEESIQDVVLVAGFRLLGIEQSRRIVGLQDSPRG